MLQRRVHRFLDRRDAGRRLAEALVRYGGSPDVVVLALPRGGVPVGYEIATALGAPLDVFEVRKLGVPGHEELAMGALGSGGARFFRREMIAQLGISQRDVAEAVAREERELERREKLYRDSRPRPEIAGKTVILVDDGVATGTTMLVAVRALRAREPARIVIALPVASTEAYRELSGEADEVVCYESPEPFYAVGMWYVDFHQLDDDEVRALLSRAAARTASPRTA